MSKKPTEMVPNQVEAQEMISQAPASQAQKSESKTVKVKALVNMHIDAVHYLEKGETYELSVEQVEKLSARKKQVIEKL